MSLAPTWITDIVVQNSQLDKNNHRVSESGALAFFLRQTNAPDSVLQEELKARAFSSIGTEIDVPLIKYGGEVAVGNVSSCTIPSTQDTSYKYRIQWTKLVTSFSIVPAQFLNNEIDIARSRAILYNSRINALAQAIDVLCAGSLEQNKTEVITDTLGYDFTGDTIKAPWEGRDHVFADTSIMMRGNRFSGPFHMVNTLGVESVMKSQLQYGPMNEVDRTIQFQDKTMYFSPNIVNDTGAFGTAYVVESGNVGLLSKVDAEQLRGTTLNDKVWSVFTDPRVGLPIGYYSYRTASDQTGRAGASTAHLDCAVEEFYQFSLYVATVVATPSDPDVLASPIIKVEVGEPGDGERFGRRVFVSNNADTPLYTATV